MSPKVGIDNLSKVMLFVYSAANIIDRATATGTTLLEKAQFMGALILQAAMLPTIDFKAVADEASDLDDLEKAKLVESLKKELHLADEKLKEIIEISIALLLKLESIGKEVTVLAQKIKEIKAA
jgi:hypothetical protein